MSLIEHAKKELEFAGFFKKKDNDLDNEMSEMMRKDVLELIEVFAKQGHSGGSAPHAVALFKKLASYEILTPLTGADEEWMAISENEFQNKRALRVFKKNGKAYDIRGKIFREPNGVCYTGKGSYVDVNFPYVPKSEYVDVPAPSGKHA